MAPVLQTLVTFTVSILLRLLLLRKMPLAVCNHLAHVVNVVLLVLAGIFFRILLENLDDLAPRVVTYGLA
jgi:hypothetical protein